MDYVCHVLTLTCIYIILGLSLNLLSGYTGLLSICQAALYGIGAYVAALVAMRCGTPLGLSLGTAVMACCIVGSVIAFVSVRVGRQYFVLFTFALQIITLDLFNNCESITGGPMGLVGVPAPRVAGVAVSTEFGLLLISALAVVLVYFLLQRVVESPFGRVLKAIREDEVLVGGLGKDVAAFKLRVFAISGGVAGVAGALYSYKLLFVHSSSFSLAESLVILSVVIVGGAGSLRGSVLGAILLTVLPEGFRFIGMPDHVAGNIRQMIYGILLIVFVLWRPNGILGEYGFERRAAR